MAGQLSELDRLQLQSRVWEPAGEALLAELGPGAGAQAVDIGCGCYGWLPPLSRWVGSTGRVTGTDISPDLLQEAHALVARRELDNVSLVRDDLFASDLPQRGFDLVHARFQLAPLGRMREQVDAYLRLLAPNGVLVLEDPDSSSWSYTPDAPALTALVGHIRTAFRAGGGDFDAGRTTYELLADAGLQPRVRAEIVALEPGHPYLRLPLQFAASLRPRLLTALGEDRLDGLLAAAALELDRPTTRGLTFTLVQTWTRLGAE